MPSLVYTSSDFPFQPFTKIFSADVNQCFNDIKTLLNTTKLDSTNVQVHGLTRQGVSSNLAAGTANHVVINDSNGDLSSEAQLALSRGGTGLNIVPGSQTPGDVIQINALGTALEIAAPSAVPASLRVFQYYNFS